jgi:cold-inducible RNA-binding protein
VCGCRQTYWDIGGFFYIKRTKDSPMDTKLYIGNLPYSTTDDELRNLFSQAGTVTSATVIMERETGRSKGFAFVEMSNQSEAEKAIQMFNGYSLGNRELRVNIARPREERAPGGFGGGRSGFGGGGGRGGPSRDRNRSSGSRSY